MPLSINFYKETRKKLLNLIEEKDLEGFLVTNPANIFYFTGFFYVTNERPSGFYLSKNNKSKLFIPLLEKENSIAETVRTSGVTWIENIKEFGIPDNCFNPIKNFSFASPNNEVTISNSIATAA